MVSWRRMLGRRMLGRRMLAFMLLGAALFNAPAHAQFSDSYNFIKAVKDRDVLKAKNLLDKPGSTVVNTRDQDSGDTALIIALKRREAPWMSFLLQNGADPNRRNRAGDTALILAAGNGYVDGIRLLLVVKANVDATNSRGETALIKAVQAREVEAVQMLLDAKADPDRSDNLTGMSARDYAARDDRSGRIGQLLADAPKKDTKQMVGPHF